LIEYFSSHINRGLDTWSNHRTPPRIATSARAAGRDTTARHGRLLR
jgi:hypothetical protein